jgi:hypothetical protein
MYVYIHDYIFIYMHVYLHMYIYIYTVFSYTYYRCPIVPALRSAWTVSLYKTVTSLMATEVGAGQIENYVNERRTGTYAENGRVYLGANLDAKKRRDASLSENSGTLISSHFPAIDNSTTDTTVTAFPQFDSHCHGANDDGPGYGGTLFSTAAQIKHIFVASLGPMVSFADQFMKSLGGWVSIIQLYIAAIIFFPKKMYIAAVILFSQKIDSQ